jgi:hypothetical protein
MNDQPHPDETPDPAAFTQAALRRQVEVLERMAEAALELAAAIKDQAIYHGPAAEAAMPFSRVARAARMIALLQSRLLKDMDEARRRDAASDDPAVSDDPLHVRKARVERIVGRIAKARTDDEGRVDRLMIEAGERLDDDDIYGDVLTKPVGELVALICRDLGLDPDWTRLAQEAWAQEEISSGATGSPFVAMQAVARPPPLAGEGDREAVERAWCAAPPAAARPDPW